jgi:hypothetical protein
MQLRSKKLISNAHYMTKSKHFDAEPHRHNILLKLWWKLGCAGIAVPNMKALMQHGRLLKLELTIALPPKLLKYGWGKEQHLEASLEKVSDCKVKVLLVASQPNSSTQ